MPERPLMKVCYVEDDEDIQRIARLALERVGKMEVSIVGDPSTAIEAILAFQPDVVLLDWMMPVVDGPTLFRKMRETDGFASTPPCTRSPHRHPANPADPAASASASAPPRTWPTATTRSGPRPRCAATAALTPCT